MGACQFTQPMCLKPHHCEDTELKDNLNFDYERYASSVDLESHRNLQEFLMNEWDQFDEQTFAELSEQLKAKVREHAKGGVPNCLVGQFLVGFLDLSTSENEYQGILDTRVLPLDFPRGSSHNFFLSASGFQRYLRLMYLLTVLFPDQTNSALVQLLVQTLLWYLPEHLSYQAMTALMKKNCQGEIYWHNVPKLQKHEEYSLFQLLQASCDITDESTARRLIRDMYATLLCGYIKPHEYSVFLINYLLGGLPVFRQFIVAIFVKYYAELVKLLESSDELGLLRSIIQLRLDIFEVLDQVTLLGFVTLAPAEPTRFSESVLERRCLESVAEVLPVETIKQQKEFSLEEDGLDPHGLFSLLIPRTNNLLVLLEVLTEQEQQTIIGVSAQTGEGCTVFVSDYHSTEVFTQAIPGWPEFEHAPAHGITMKIDG